MSRTLLGLSLLWSLSAQGTPRMSLTAGAPCQTCHSSPAGGGGRTELGWSSMNRVGALSYEQIGLKSLHEVENRGMMDGALSIGGDSRLMFLRLGRPRLEFDAEGNSEVVNPEPRLLPMQLQPNLRMEIGEWLNLYGHYTAGPNTKDGEICDEVFPGQSCFEAAIQVEPSGGLPQARMGMIQPSIGVRSDDHSLLIHGDAFNRRRPLIAPNYAELGVEASLQSSSWLRVETGLTGTHRLDQALNGGLESADLWPLAYLARVTLLPQLEFGGSAQEERELEDDFDDFDSEPAPSGPPSLLNTWLGGSIFGSGEFMLLDGFLGLGSLQGLELRLEIAYSKRGEQHEILNLSSITSWALWDWLILMARAERGHTRREEGEYETLQAVVGLEFFPLPFIELRPEYRLVQTDEYRFAQPTIQLHLFY